MAERLPIADMATVLLERTFPTVTVWNRIEGRPRSVEFDRALRAEVRDALWMLTRQWQLGEFYGDDAGSPVTATMQLSNTRLTSFRARDATPVSIDESVPLESVVERRAPMMEVAGQVAAIDLRLALGRRWLKLVAPAYRSAFIARYGFEAPDRSDPADAELAAHPDVLSRLQALAGRNAMDGHKLYAHLKASAGNHPYDGLTVAAADKPAMDAAAAAFVQWFDQFVERPARDTSWDPSRLEHRFSVTAVVEDGEKRLVAEEYPGGRLDWHSFSVDPGSARGGGAMQPATTVFPAPVRFDGMPDTRWWAFEDGRTNLGAVRADTTDLAKLLFMEFALVYGNDWSLIPCDLPVGSVARVEGLAVTNVFGERLWIESANRGGDQDWQRWAMYGLDVAGTGDEPADTALLLLPTVPKASEGPQLEAVALVRDEMANMVWGIEQTVPLATGEGRRGAEAANETLGHRVRLVGAAAGTPPEQTASIAYRVMLAPPEHWIPFVPMHVPGDNRETQLQRAALPRVIEGDTGPVQRVRPRTSLLREGLDETTPVPYFIHEEEVPRAGTHVSTSFQRTRWRDGRVVLWLGARRSTGRGEASSGMAFDHLEESPPSAES